MKGVGIAAGLDAAGSDGVSTELERRCRPRQRRLAAQAPQLRRRLPRAHQLPVHRPVVALGAAVRRAHPDLGPRVRDQRPQPRDRVRRRHPVAVHACASGGADIDDVRDALDPLGLGDAKVLILGDDAVRVQSEETSPRRSRPRCATALAEYAGIQRRAGERHQRRPHVGRQGQRQGTAGPRRVLPGARALPHVPLRVPHGDRPRSSRWSTTSSSPSASTRSPGSR